MLVWLHATPLEVGRTYLVKHTSRQTRIRALQIRHRVNVNTFEKEQTIELNMNEIASVDFEAHVPLFFDPYASARATGSFILIDAVSNATVGAGMIQEDVQDREGQEGLGLPSLDFVATGVRVEARYERHGHYPATFLLENRPALASRLERALFESGFEALHLDGAAASPGALVQTIRAMLGIGAVSIYSGDVLDAETKAQLVADVKAKLFELSRENENANDEEVFRRALALAQTLRFAKLESNEEEAN
jgi:bifunctional enzyme CysN/CysC/sulfate adenylyltransferase subunit 1